MPRIDFNPLDALRRVSRAIAALGAEAVTLVCRRGAESIGATVLEQTFAQVWAGGDWAGGKVDLTVQSVEDGKRAAASIDASLRA